MNIRPVGAELFHADGKTGGVKERRIDMKKLIVAFFLNFANAPKNVTLLSVIQKRDIKCTSDLNFEVLALRYNPRRVAKIGASK
jgi:hypothetical protein